jgi:hypothetical protein
MTTKYGPWTPLLFGERPPGLKDDQRIEVLCTNYDGEIKFGLAPRSARAHSWSERTIAYRTVIETKTHVAYGQLGYSFNGTRFPDDTHKITYEVEDGKVVSCKMEAL